MKNAPHNWTYYVRKDIGIGENILLYRKYNYQVNKPIQCNATENNNRVVYDNSDYRNYGWVEAYTFYLTDMRSITQIQAEIFWPNLTKK